MRFDLVEILGDDGRVDDDGAVVVERGYDAIWVELEVVGLELVAVEQIELYLLERQLLCVQHKTHALAASRLRRIIKLVSHVRLPVSFIKAAASPPSVDRLESDGRRPRINNSAPRRCR